MGVRRGISRERSDYGEKGLIRQYGCLFPPCKNPGSAAGWVSTRSVRACKLIGNERWACILWWNRVPQPCIYLCNELLTCVQIFLLIVCCDDKDVCCDWYWFVPRDAMHTMAMVCAVVWCQSVRLSVTFVYCIETSKLILKLFWPPF